MSIGPKPDLPRISTNLKVEDNYFHLSSTVVTVINNALFIEWTTVGHTAA